MKKVYICSPLGGNVLENIKNAKVYAKYVFGRGMAPVIPHFYATILDDEIEAERNLGKQAGIFFVKLSMAYMDYRKHGQFEFTAPAILFACLVFSLTAPLYIWTIL